MINVGVTKIELSTNGQGFFRRRKWFHVVPEAWPRTPSNMSGEISAPGLGEFPIGLGCPLETLMIMLRKYHMVNPGSSHSVYLKPPFYQHFTFALPIFCAPSNIKKQHKICLAQSPSTWQCMGASVSNIPVPHMGSSSTSPGNTSAAFSMAQATLGWRPWIPLDSVFFRVFFKA